MSDDQIGWNIAIHDCGLVLQPEHRGTATSLLETLVAGVVGSAGVVVTSVVSLCSVCELLSDLAGSLSGCGIQVVSNGMGFSFGNEPASISCFCFYDIYYLQLLLHSFEVLTLLYTHPDSSYCGQVIASILVLLP